MKIKYNLKFCNRNDKVIQEQRRIDQELKKAYLDNNNLIKDVIHHHKISLKNKMS